MSKKPSGAALDCAVMEAEGLDFDLEGDSPVTGRTIWDEDGLGWAEYYSPSTDWVQGGPIIEREKIEIAPWGADGAWRARSYWNEPSNSHVHVATSEAYGPTPLIAAMRCYVASKQEGTVSNPTLNPNPNL